jgi:3-mercaptopyruvate sulfurtransferase SseA
MLAAILAAPAMATTMEGAYDRPDPLPEWWYTEGEVDAEFVAEHMVIPRDLDQIAIVDARPYMNKYVKGYIPTAINIPQTELKNMEQYLPEDKSTLVIFYCEGFS